MASGNLRTIHFPAQKKSIKQKNEKWRKDNIDAAEEYVSLRHEGYRKTHKNKRINYDLYSDILDQSDVERICNPFKLKHLTFPAIMQNYPIANPKIDLLVGESLKRRLDIRVRVANQDAVSEKEKALRSKWEEVLKQILTEGITDQNQVQQKLAEFDRYKTYEFHRLHEELRCLVTWRIKRWSALVAIIIDREDAPSPDTSIFSNDFSGVDTLCEIFERRGLVHLRS